MLIKGEGYRECSQSELEKGNMRCIFYRANGTWDFEVRKNIRREKPENFSTAYDGIFQGGH